MFTYNEVLSLLSGADDEWLYNEANRVKEENYGKEVFLRGIIETSNYCENNCWYCGIRKNNNCKRYRLTSKEIIETAKNIKGQNIGSIVLQGGEENTKENIDILRKVIPVIKELSPETDVVLSHGILPHDVYAELKELGATRYLIKMETLQKDLYEKIRPGQKIKDRIDAIESLINIGYQVGSGFIVGMPGYNIEMFARDILRLQELGVHMFSTTPFIATPKTPWSSEVNGDCDIVCRAAAIYRILEPLVNIPATTALSVLSPVLFKKSLERGCNVVMCSFTPPEEKVSYKIYEGKGVSRDIPNIVKMKELVKKQGLFIVDNELGRSKK